MTTKMITTDRIFILYELEDPTHSYFFREEPTNKQIVEIAESLGLAGEELELSYLKNVVFGIDEQYFYE